MQNDILTLWNTFLKRRSEIENLTQKVNHLNQLTEQTNRQIEAGVREIRLIGEEIQEICESVADGLSRQFEELDWSIKGREYGRMVNDWKGAAYDSISPDVYFNNQKPAQFSGLDALKQLFRLTISTAQTTSS
ncbi:MAG: hypothetical protein KatS3mg104_2105 [Phycisphaerae bacterium]|jgi:uncharacterized protein with HEPN domain|nr:MAG: hypothetical protein KatS3mg104_2105 [Phycisphaerae bacterium]